MKWGILSIFHINMFQIGVKYKRRGCVQVKKKNDKFEKSWILYVYAVLHVSTAGPTQGLLITHDFWKKIFYTHEIKKEKKNTGTILVKWGILSIFHISMFQIGEKYKRRRCSVQVSRMINLKSPEFCMYMEEWHEDQYCYCLIKNRNEKILFA